MKSKKIIGLNRRMCSAYCCLPNLVEKITAILSKMATVKPRLFDTFGNQDLDTSKYKIDRSQFNLAQGISPVL